MISNGASSDSYNQSMSSSSSYPRPPQFKAATRYSTETWSQSMPTPPHDTIFSQNETRYVPDSRTFEMQSMQSQRPAHETNFLQGPSQKGPYNA